MRRHSAFLAAFLFAAIVPPVVAQGSRPTECWTETDIRKAFPIYKTETFDVRRVEGCRFKIQATYEMSSEHPKADDPITVGVSRWTGIYETGKPMRMVSVERSDSGGDDLGGCNNPVCLYDSEGRLTKEGAAEATDLPAGGLASVASESAPVAKSPRFSDVGPIPFPVAATFACFIVVGVLLWLFQTIRSSGQLANIAIMGLSLIALVVVIGAIGFVFFGGHMGETGQAERLIAEKFSATGVRCQRLGDLVGVRQWTCRGRWNGTDSYPFWANADESGMRVGMGTGQ